MNPESSNIYMDMFSCDKWSHSTVMNPYCVGVDLVIEQQYTFGLGEPKKHKRSS